MVRYIILLSVLSGCNYYGELDLSIKNYEPCVKADVVIDGICFETYREEISPTLVASTLDHLEEAFAYHNFYIDMRMFVVDKDIGVRMMPLSINMTNGNQRKNLIKLKDHNDSSPVVYVTLGHELIHAVAQYELKISFEENKGHSLETLFVSKAGVWADLSVEGIMKTRVNKDWGMGI